jgi:hypothetical protein
MLVWNFISRTKSVKDLLGSENDELGGTTVQGLGGPRRKKKISNHLFTESDMAKEP